MGKLIGVTILIAAALIILNRQKVEDYKQKIIETVNPAAKERRLLGELENSLAVLEKLSLADKQKVSATLSNARSTLQELRDTNQKADLGANLSNLIQKIVPFDLKPSPTWLPSSKECKPI